MTLGNDYHLDDTVVALASSKGGAARGIVRLSGPKTREIVEQIFWSGDPPCNDKSVAVRSGELRLETLDHRAILLPADVYLWPVGRSYTGGQVAEFHTVGSPPLLDVVVRACCQHGARLAEPGEFTLRAFLAGRIDLTQAEAVAGIIDADDAKELDTALDQLAGGLARPLQLLRETMLNLLAQLEAGFDYADEDLAFITEKSLVAGLRQCKKEIAGLLVQLERRGDASDSARVGLFGGSNEGKSSLFNVMTGDTRAIVSHLPGTTRDYLTATLDVKGTRFELIDTAGVDSELISDASPDRAARQASIDQAERVNVRLFCFDATSLEACASLSYHFPSSDSTKSFFVVTKIDLLDAAAREAVEQKCQTFFGTDDVGPIFTSAVTHEGVKALLEQICKTVLLLASPGGTAVSTTAARCDASLREADESLRRALYLTESSLGEELVAAELRLALEAIGKVAGTVYTEEILEQVFRNFCVGK